jgi:hypothetical protein
MLAAGIQVLRENRFRIDCVHRAAWWLNFQIEQDTSADTNLVFCEEIFRSRDRRRKEYFGLIVSAEHQDCSAVRKLLFVVVETTDKLESLDPGFTNALHDSKGLNFSVGSQRSCQPLGMSNQPYLCAR